MEKASRTIRNNGIEKDIELLRSVMGELSTHCASFNPKLYERDLGFPTHSYPTFQMGAFQTTDYDDSFRILFNEGGIISRKVWDGSRKQGLVADLPLLELEKYYDFIEFYNRYYSRAMKLLVKDEKTEVKPSDIKMEEFDFYSFHAFREAYADLETVLFAFLSYILGYMSKTYLSPLKAEFRRMPRILLEKLVDYALVDPVLYKDKIDAFVNNYYTEFEFVDEDGYLLSIDEWKEYTKTLSLEEKFKMKIKKYDLSATDLNEIFEKIYERENVQRFYRRVSVDFKLKYIVLQDKCVDLKPKMKNEEEKPKKQQIEMSGQLTVLKGHKLSDAKDTVLSQGEKARE